MTVNEEPEAAQPEPARSQQRSASVRSAGAVSALDWNDPRVFLAAAFPAPAGEGATLLPASPTSPEKGGVAVAERDLVPVVDRTVADEVSSDRERDREREHSRRAAQALAEVGSTARQRGLLKESAESVDDAEAVADAPAETGQDRPDTGAAATELEDGMDVNGGPGSARLHLVSRWMHLKARVQDVFLLDDRGYSLLPEGDAESQSDKVALHDLGLRLATVLDVAQRRQTGASDGDDDEVSAAAGAGVPVARLSLSDGRCLAVLRSAPGGALLGWLEDGREPISETLAGKARQLLRAALDAGDA